MQSGLKVCSLDPLPSLLMKNCVDVLLPIVTNIVNCSLDSYTVPHVMKEALVRPILKKALAWFRSYLHNQSVYQY